MILIKYSVKCTSHRSEYTNFFETSHGHQDAKEEQNGAHVDAAQQVGNALLERHVFVIMMQSAVEYLGYCP